MSTRILTGTILAALMSSPLCAVAFPRTAVDDRDAGAADKADTEPAGELSLHDALAAASSRNPELLAYSWVIRSADARSVSAAVRPNPELSLEAENIAGSGGFEGEFENTLQLSQLFELGGKRGKRREVAERETDRARLDYAAKQVDVLFDTTVDFIDTVSEQEVEKLARIGVRQARELIGEAKKRTNAGIGSPLEIKRAQILTARAEIAVLRAERRLHAARYKLAARWGATEPNFTAVKGDLFTTQPVPPLELLLRRLEEAPERRAAAAEERLRTAELELARARRTPDLTVSLGWRHGESLDDQAGVAGFSVPLRIFDRGQGEQAEAVANSGRAQADTRTIDMKLRAALVGLHQELLRATGELALMRKEIVPRAEESLTLARDGFAKGLFSQLELLEAQKTVIEARAEQIEAATAYHRLVAETERLLGGAL